MRAIAAGGSVAVFIILLAGCGAQAQVPEGAASASASASSTVTPTPDGEASTEPSDEGATVSADPPPTPSETSPAPEGDPVAFVSPKDVPADVMLSDDDLDHEASSGAVRTETEGLVPWIYTDSIYGFDKTCVDTAAVPAEAMRTVKVTDPEMQVSTGLQQVAVFADVAQAEKAFEEVTSRLEECTTTAGDSPLYRSETFPVGAGEGFGFITDYSPSFPEGSGVGTGIGDDAVGNYLGFVRRGNAITLVWSTGGERIVGEERDRVAGRAAKAWPLLCRYDPAGC